MSHFQIILSEKEKHKFNKREIKNKNSKECYIDTSVGMVTLQKFDINKIPTNQIADL